MTDESEVAENPPAGAPRIPRFKMHPAASELRPPHRAEAECGRILAVGRRAEQQVSAIK
jgi:hypothetical protein